MIDILKVYTSRSYGDFKIISYIDCYNVKVRFISTGYVCTTTASQVTTGSIMDKLVPAVFGVGFIGGSHYKAKSKGYFTKRYQTWAGILERCYCPKYRKRQPTYADCTVAEEWHNFQVFAKWFDENYISGFDIDKDIKIHGNKMYSSETCLFVSHTDNNIKAQAKSYNFIDPNGNHVKIYNIKDFCRGTNLGSSSMCAVHRGDRSHHKGWTI